MDDEKYLSELQEAVLRRYAERTADSKLPAITVPDFRRYPGIELQTYGWLVSRDDLEDDPYAAAEGIVGRVLGLEAMLIVANPTARGRVFLLRRRGPAVFWRVPPNCRAFPPEDLTPEQFEEEKRLIKVRFDFALRGPEDEPAHVLRTPIGPIGADGSFPILKPAEAL